MEPVYQYVKGEGWVPQAIEWFEVTKNGQRYRLEMRPPNPGEAFRYTTSGWTLAQWRAWTEQYWNLAQTYQNYDYYMRSIAHMESNPNLSVISIFKV